MRHKMRSRRLMSWRVSSCSTSPWDSAQLASQPNQAATSRRRRGGSAPTAARSATPTPGPAPAPPLADRRQLRPHPAQQLGRYRRRPAPGTGTDPGHTAGYRPFAREFSLTEGVLYVVRGWSGGKA
jgi:hypothetical protein